MAIIYGTGGEDFLAGTNNADTIYGYGFNDQILGKDGGDTIYGGGGADRINGDGGGDTIHGGKGNDQLWGGSGADKFVFGGGSGTDHIMDWQDGADKIKIDAAGVNVFGDLEIDEAAFGGDDGVKITWGTGELIFIAGAEKGDLSGADFIL